MLDAWAKHAVNTREWRLLMAVGSGERETTTYPGLAGSWWSTFPEPVLTLLPFASVLQHACPVRSATTLGALASQTPTLPTYTFGLRESL